MSLCLCDTNAEEDIHINDELVSNEYAICPEINSPETSAAGQVHYPLAHIYCYISCSLFKRDTFLRHTFLLMIFPHTLFPQISSFSQRRGRRGRCEKKDTAGASYLIVQPNVGGSLLRKSPYKGIGTAYCSLRNEMERNEMERNEMKICSLRNENL